MRICAITGQESDGKHYILKTTDGEELISAEALFHPQADQVMGSLLLDLARRLGAIEEALNPTDSQVAAEDSGKRIAKAAAAAAAPVKKAPRQRKAAD